MRTLNNSVYLNVSILIFTLFSPSLLFDEFFSIIGLGVSIPRLLFFFNIVFLALYYSSKGKATYLDKYILYILVIALVYWIIIGFLLYSGTGFTTRARVRNVIIIISILFIISNKRFSIESLLNAFVMLAFILSILSLFQYFGYLAGIIKLRNYSYYTYDPGYQTFAGFGGFARHFVGDFYRNQSFFKEPARFAQFLLIPMFVSLHNYFVQQNRRKRNLVILISIFGAFFLTFSVANFFGLLFGLLIYNMFNKKKNIQSNVFLTIFLRLSIITIITYASFTLYTHSSINDLAYVSGSILGKNLPKRFLERQDRFNVATSVLKEGNYFGDISIRKNWTRNPTAIGNIIIFGGIPLFVIVLIMVVPFYKNAIKNIRRNKTPLIYAGSIAYFVGFNWYGDYFEIIFLFQLILLTTLMKKTYPSILSSHKYLK